MSIKFYNTLTRKEEEFKEIESGKVKIITYLVIWLEKI